MTELTDRYLFAATRSLPAAQREELSRDLAERIADTIDARVDSGASTPETAEHDALVELGHPAVLAASYSDRPLMLIGPRYFLVWKRLLIFLESFVPATVAAATALGLVLSGGGWEIVGTVVTTGLTVAVHLAFWVTLVFALIERYDTGAVGSADKLLGWTPDQLPQLPEVRRPHRRSDLIASLVWLAIAAGLLVWQQFGVLWIGGERSAVPLLAPELWSFWLPYLFVLIALEAAFAVWIYRSDWNWANALVNVALSAAFAIPVIWLFVEGMLLSPEFLAAIDPYLDADAERVLSVLFIGGVAAICAWDSIDGIIKAVRGGGRGTLDFPGNRSPRRAEG
ncbi:permease prefix domain 1-containing protein [Agromyces lapidis]|uniref:Permease prefix domain 1-containing protein n=1 Tax=Agromyces lapidis TaxID=279574 RepID=A0ABV5SRH4_9MICO|nr:permease prefix domain 1-containing protein [Agromyces lapidis]